MWAFLTHLFICLNSLVQLRSTQIKLDQIDSNWIKIGQDGSGWLFASNQIKLVQIGSNSINLDQIDSDWFLDIQLNEIVSNWNNDLQKFGSGGLSPTPALSFVLLSLIIGKLRLRLKCLNMFKLVLKFIYCEKAAKIWRNLHRSKNI